MNFPATLTLSIDSKSDSLSFGRYSSESESYLWKWLLSFIKQIPVQSERVWLIVERHAYLCNPNLVCKPLWSIPAHPIPFYHTLSILSVLPQCDSAMNVFSIHSSIPHHTAAQPALGTKSYHCSQISFVFLNLLIGVCAKMPRSQWIAVCIHSIKKMICSSPDGLWTCLITFY